MGRLLCKAIKCNIAKSQNILWSLDFTNFLFVCFCTCFWGYLHLNMKAFVFPIDASFIYTQVESGVLYLGFLFKFVKS